MDCNRKLSFVSGFSVHKPEFPQYCSPLERAGGPAGRARVCGAIQLTLPQGRTPRIVGTRTVPRRARRLSTKQSTGEGPLILRKTGMNSAMVLSRELQELFGTEMMTRSELLAQICGYIKKNNLYAEGNKQKFVCDQTLKRVLRTDGEHLFLHLQKLIAPLLTHPSRLGPEYQAKADKVFQDYLKRKGAVDTVSARQQRQDRRGTTSRKVQRSLRERGAGMFVDVEVAPSLRRICGGKEQLSRSQIVKAVWDYIKHNKLQDPANRRRIKTSAELRIALHIPDVEMLDTFHVSRHVLKLCGGLADNNKTS